MIEGRWKLPFPDGTLVTISAHALERFCERFAVHYGHSFEAKNTRKVLQAIIAKARPETLPAARRVARILSNGCQKASYWRSGVWRLVVTQDQGEMILKTIEIRGG